MDMPHVLFLLEIENSCCVNSYMMEKLMKLSKLIKVNLEHSFTGSNAISSLLLISN